MKPLISDEMIEAALLYLANGSDAAAAATAERVRMAHKKKQVRAKLILDSNASTMLLREAYAEASEVYEAVCEDEANAIEQDEWHRNQRNKAETIIEAWRTMQATQRAGSNFR